MDRLPVEDPACAAVLDGLRARVRERRRRDRGSGRDGRRLSYALSLATGYRYAGYHGEGPASSCRCAARRAVELALTWGEGLGVLVVAAVTGLEAEGERFVAPCEDCRWLLGSLVRGFWVDGDGRVELRSSRGALTADEWAMLRSGLARAGSGDG